MLQCGECEILIPCSQIRQGIANNTKGTAFVVYEDVMDAKQACDKLNGFNFQNRYLVGESCPGPNDFVATNSLTTCSTISSAREDGTVERGPRSPQGEFRAAQKAARYRITNRRACGTHQPISSFSCRSVRGSVYEYVWRAEGQRSFTFRRE